MPPRHMEGMEIQMNPPTAYEESVPFTREDFETLRLKLKEVRGTPMQFVHPYSIERRSTADNDGSWLRRREPK